ncbi:MAG: NAD-dependent protein deacylase, partial [Gammaproteobacteria bacterium]|nr:NAD-dependent protein deacylase [Gammaproteobacteria bacterium]
LKTAASAAQDCDVFLSIGTSSLVWPAAGLAETARDNGAVVIEINLDATTLSERSDHYLQGKSGELLPELIDYLTL